MKKAPAKPNYRKSPNALKRWARQLRSAVPYQVLCLYEMHGWPGPFSLRFSVNYPERESRHFERRCRKSFRRFNGPAARSRNLRGQVFTSAELLRLRPRASDDAVAALRALGLALIEHTDFSYYLVAFVGNSVQTGGFLTLHRRVQGSRDFNTRDKRKVQKLLPELERILEDRAERLRRSDPAAWLEEHFRLGGLSRREVEVARLALEGLAMKEMAEKLCVDVVTVRDHLKHIYPKLGVSTRAALMAQILRLFGILK